MMQFCSSAFDGTFADGNVVDRADMDSVGFVHFRVFRIFILYSHQRIMFLLFLYLNVAENFTSRWIYKL